MISNMYILICILLVDKKNICKYFFIYIIQCTYNLFKLSATYMCTMIKLSIESGVIASIQFNSALFSDTPIH